MDKKRKRERFATAILIEGLLTSDTHCSQASNRSARLVHPRGSRLRLWNCIPPRPPPRLSTLTASHGFVRLGPLTKWLRLYKTVLWAALLSEPRQIVRMILFCQYRQGTRSATCYSDIWSSRASFTGRYTRQVSTFSICTTSCCTVKSRPLHLEIWQPRLRPASPWLYKPDGILE